MAKVTNIEVTNFIEAFDTNNLRIDYVPNDEGGTSPVSINVVKFLKQDDTVLRNTGKTQWDIFKDGIDFLAIFTDKEIVLNINGNTGTDIIIDDFFILSTKTITSIYVSNLSLTDDANITMVQAVKL